jgi:hypothetical protein
MFERGMSCGWRCVREVTRASEKGIERAVTCTEESVMCTESERERSETWSRVCREW